MATAIKEIVLPENCPGCMQADGTENPLRNQLGVFGTYCLNDKNDRVHMYSDTDELRDEIAKMKRLKPKAVKAAAPVKPAEEPPSAEATDEKISTVEATVFNLTEMDCYRLSELLGIEVTSSGDLVGAVYTMRNDLSELRGTAERRDMQQRGAGGAASNNLIPSFAPVIQQRPDGGLALQVFIPEPYGYKLIDRAVFNHQTVKEYVQALMEYQMDGQFFPCDVADFSHIPPTNDGFWVAVSIPEIYTAATADKALTLEITPTEYLQRFIYHLIDLELFP